MGENHEFGMNSNLEFRLIRNEDEFSLAKFLETIKQAGDEFFFHPHPLNAEYAKSLMGYAGEDLYYILVSGNEILGYGMLRGWDEGYDVPSLGIVIHPSTRGRGLGKFFMDFLHTAASWKGAKKVRLKVDPNNLAAVHLYEKLGYEFTHSEQDQLVGYLVLNKR